MQLHCYHALMRVLLFLFLCLCAEAAFAQRTLTTIPINYASADQLVSVIRPYLSEGSSVSAYQNQLVLNVTPEELAKTRELLSKLDAAGRQLRISLRTDANGSDSSKGVDVNAAIKSGDTVITNGPGGRVTETRTTVRVLNQDGSSTGNGSQSVRATEGTPAYISTGMTAPIQTYTVGPNGRRYAQQEYVNAASGFYATTWVNDGTVRINIDQSNDRLHGQTIATQQLRTEVTGRLGEWLPIGGLNDSSTQHSSGLGSTGQSSRSNSTQLFLKVDLLDE
jgi:type II secretory pathway component GspD/PulD (secretin)